MFRHNSINVAAQANHRMRALKMGRLLNVMEYFNKVPISIESHVIGYLKHSTTDMAKHKPQSPETVEV